MPAPLPGHPDGCTCVGCMIAFGCAPGEGLLMPIESPWDHNVECRYCDEQAAHRADCPWLMQLEAKAATAAEALAGLVARVASQEEELVKANLKVEALRDHVTNQEQQIQLRTGDLERTLAKVTDQEQIITNQLRNLGELRAKLDTHERLQDQALAISELLRRVGIGPCPLTEGVAQVITQATDFAAKLQLLITVMDERGQLPEHVFTFPDGDTWEAKP